MGERQDRKEKKKRKEKKTLSPASRLRGLEWESSVIQSKAQSSAALPASSSAPGEGGTIGFAKGGI